MSGQHFQVFNNTSLKAPAVCAVFRPVGMLDASNSLAELVTLWYGFKVGERVASCSDVNIVRSLGQTRAAATLHPFPVSFSGITQVLFT